MQLPKSARRRAVKLLKRILSRYGYRILNISGQERDSGFRSTEAINTYVEREEYGPSNILTKVSLVARGDPFESPDIVRLNDEVVKLLESERSIVELGAGTGKFAESAAQDLRRTIVASELDTPTYQWCLNHHPRRSNLRYVNTPVSPADGPFDLVVAIEVIEHVKDYVGFLDCCSKLAPRALITTPNRRRSSKHNHAGPPKYYKHVREWTAGEFYWVMRCFWNKVILYGIDNIPNTFNRKVDVDSEKYFLLADCRNSLVEQRSHNTNL